MCRLSMRIPCAPLKKKTRAVVYTDGKGVREEMGKRRRREIWVGRMCGEWRSPAEAERATEENMAEWGIVERAKKWEKRPRTQSRAARAVP